MLFISTIITDLSSLRKRVHCAESDAYVIMQTLIIIICQTKNEKESGVEETK